MPKTLNEIIAALPQESQDKIERRSQELISMKPAWASVNALIAGLANLNIETEQEDDGRIIAEISALPGCLVYGQSEEEAIRKVQALALRVIADNIEHGV